MINYLNQKYDAEFVYYDYEPPELLNSEKLYAYPKSTGIGNGKYLVTVKARNGGFEDDFHDFSYQFYPTEFVKHKDDITAQNKELIIFRSEYNGNQNRTFESVGGNTGNWCSQSHFNLF